MQPRITRTLVVVGMAALLVATAGMLHAQVNGRVATRLVPLNAGGRLGSTVTLSARLSEFHTDRSIVGRRIDVYVLYPTYASWVGRAYTNSRGVAEVRLSLVATNVPGPGVYPVGWHFAGDGTYSSPVPTASLTVTR